MCISEITFCVKRSDVSKGDLVVHFFYYLLTYLKVRRNQLAVSLKSIHARLAMQGRSHFTCKGKFIFFDGGKKAELKY